jgi:hypothetical protein
MASLLRGPALVLAALLLASCAHAPPQVVQVFTQVNRVYDPATATWSARLAAFVQGSSPDGAKVFDRLHLIHDGQGLYFTLDRAHWTKVERPGEVWMGSPGLAFPDGQVPTGPWRVLLVTRDGQKVETSFAVPPPAPGTPEPRKGPVRVAALAGVPGKYQVSGWPEDTLVWVLDGQGTVLARTKVSGTAFQVPPGAASFVLYSYDKARGEGLEAGPFPVQSSSKPADR